MKDMQTSHQFCHRGLLKNHCISVVVIGSEVMLVEGAEVVVSTKRAEVVVPIKGAEVVTEGAGGVRMPHGLYAWEVHVHTCKLSSNTNKLSGKIFA